MDEGSPTSASPDLPRGRRRISADEARNRMLAAARDIVFELGMTVSLEDVSMEEVMRRAQVPRSSVYRLWPYKGDFVDDLLCHLAGPEWVGVSPGQARTLAVARDVIRANRDRLNSPEGRLAVTRETARQAIACSFEDLLSAKGWTFYFALAGTIDYVRDAQARARIAAALEESEQVRVRSLAAFYRELAGVVGLRLRDGYRFEHLALAGGALLQGLLVREIVARNSPRDQSQSTDEDVQTPHRMLTHPLPGHGLDGETADWSFAASAYLAIFESILEPDPNFSPADPPANW
ncbi:TetR/AcrR family transcriptional regulator [Amycolatopsis mediterranei]|uniref:TetR/AcrR family transcriptional regulator n=1 Tax=Amycolatopsis mediterranei TaxID=33910 RepID=UPI0034232A99